MNRTDTLRVAIFLRDHSKELKLTSTQRLAIIFIATRNGINPDYFVTQKSIAHDLNIDVRQVRRILDPLVVCGAIEVTEIGNKHNYKLSSKYEECIKNTNLFETSTGHRRPVATGHRRPVEEDHTKYININNNINNINHHHTKSHYLSAHEEYQKLLNNEDGQNIIIKPIELQSEKESLEVHDDCDLEFENISDFPKNHQKAAQEDIGPKSPIVSHTGHENKQQFSILSQFNIHSNPFKTFCSEWPRTLTKYQIKECWHIWHTQNYDAIAEQINDNVILRKSTDKFWLAMIAENKTWRIKSASNFLLERFWKKPFTPINDITTGVQHETNQRYRKPESYPEINDRVFREIKEAYLLAKAREDAEAASGSNTEPPDDEYPTEHTEGWDFMENEASDEIPYLDGSAFYDSRSQLRFLQSNHGR